MKPYLLLALLLSLLVSCNNNEISEETLQADADMLANLQCDAKKLQEERFQLANNIRFLEDSVMATQDSMLLIGYKAKLADLAPQKESVLERTKIMADSISKTMMKLQQGTYKDTADRKLLDVALNKKFEQICK